MSANDEQVAGDHYKQGGKPQHWDLVITYQWDYFQAQITKYLMRWKTKHDTPTKRLEDLKKARHFLDKYIENFEAYDRGMDVVPPAEKFARLSAASQSAIVADGVFSDGTVNCKCTVCGHTERGRLDDVQAFHVCRIPVKV